MMNRFASNTTVPVARTKMEIERLLNSHQATEFLYGSKDDMAMLAFKIKNRTVKMMIPIPSQTDAQKTKAGRIRHSIDMIATVREQSVRTRWRAIFLIIKAKLEAVEAGISTLEKEFLADLLLANGSTLGQLVAPNLDRITRDAVIPGLPSGVDHTTQPVNQEIASKCKVCGVAHFEDEPHVLVAGPQL